MQLLTLMRETGLDLLALVWPTACVACGAADRDCCDPCRSLVRTPEPIVERQIGLPCFAAGPYAGPVRAMLVAFKHAGQVKFARDLGPRLRAPIERALGELRGPEAPIIVTAPSRPARVRQRGYRHVELLVTSALRGWRLCALRIRPLRALRGRTAQLGLAAGERERNARRVAVRASCRKLISGREVIIVDDVITTGATLRAAAEALEHAGARVVAAVALCAVPRRDEDSVNIRVAPASAKAVEFEKGVTVRHIGPPA